VADGYDRPPTTNAGFFIAKAYEKGQLPPASDPIGNAIEGQFERGQDLESHGISMEMNQMQTTSIVPPEDR
jgi:hypothetical protein